MSALAQSSTAETIAQFDRYVIPNYRRYPGLPGQGRGVVGLGRRGAPLPRLLPGLGLQPAGPLPAAGRRGGPRAGRPADPRAEHLVHGAAGGVRPGALRAVAVGGQCFFCNSGAEANEAAIKLARAYGHAAGRYKIVTMEGGFHGRTYAALTATAQPKYHAGFEPMVPGFVYVPYNDLDAVAARDRRPDGRRAGRADPGRRGHQHPRRPATCRACASSATSAACC